MRIQHRLAVIGTLSLGLVGLGATSATAAPLTEVAQSPTAQAQLAGTWVHAGFYRAWLACKEDGLEGEFFTAATDHRCDTVHNSNGSTRGYDLYLYFP